jgi:ubiquinone/menaquinone biosynthesis C-methylase UbiE
VRQALPPTDIALAASRQQERAYWARGDYSVIGTTFQIVSENLVESADVQSGERVLDVAAGSGNATLAAARRYARVTSTDVVAAWLDKGRDRARIESLPATFDVADVHALPYADASFDVAISVFGVMYASDPATAAWEMRRVLKPGGRIALACWTQRGFVGRLVQLMATHLPDTGVLAASTRWGAPTHLVRLFGVLPRQVRCRHRHFNFRYRSAAHWVQVFRDFHGPTHAVFAGLGPSRQHALERDIAALLEASNTAGTTSLVVPAEYLEAFITPGEAAPPLQTLTPY